ncbi:dityrosine transporter [Fusarium mexicanum]|uniref:Dityrosine transporter n=1 Tax=Fusarium mexicanum TaxID=751941 RepID=A0A8H5IJF7_9HYPO|nr:dityrosine transporter [Fusarium mexicanum]
MSAPKQDDDHIGDSESTHTRISNQDPEKQSNAEIGIPDAPYSSFSLWQKRLIVLAAASTALFSPMTAQIYFPALPAIANDLGVTTSQINLTVTTYMIFQGITPMFIGSLADSGGRRPAYLVCFTIYIAANIGLALAPSYGALLGLRCLQSAGSASTVALCFAVVADVVTSAERGQYIGLTAVPSVLGPSLGPIIGGVLAEFLGWRSIFWFLAIFAGVTIILLALFYPETCREIVGDGSIKAPLMYRSVWQILVSRRKRSETEKNGLSRQGSRASTVKKFKFKFPNVLNSILMLFEKETGFLLGFSSICFAGFYCIATAMPTLFKEIYGYNELEIGLTFLPMAAGSVIAAFIVGAFTNRNFKRHCEKQGIPYERSKQQDLSGFPIERARLEIGFPLLMLAAATLVCWGWAVHARAHIAVPCVLSGILGVGVVGFNNTVNSLLIDIHPRKAGTASAANNLTRCLVGAGASAAIVPMIDAMGTGWAFTLVGGLYVLGCPILITVMVCGIKWREELRVKEEKKQKAIEAQEVSFHPLARIPGPRLAAISSFWHAYNARMGRMAYLGKTLHRKYGPVVRVGPNEVWFDSKEAFHAIYSSGSGYEKSDFYLATALSKPHIDWHLNPEFQDTLDLLSERDVRRYRLQRRLIGPVYQTSNLIQYEAAIDEVLARSIAKLKTLNGAQVELNEWMHIIAVECLGAVVLSWSPGMLKNGTDNGSGAHAYHGWRRKSVFGLFPMAAKLEFLHKSIGRLFSTIWGVNFQPPKDFRPFFPDVGKRVSRRVNAATKSKLNKDDRKDLLADLIQLHRTKPNFTELYLRKMAVTNFGAGHETMASTLTSIFALLGSNDDVQAQVSLEILGVSNTAEYSTATRLPEVQSLIKEAKRLYPVISMSLPRKVPSEGLYLHGYYFPPNTTVGCNPVALHRNPDIFGSDSDMFNPARWQTADPDAARTMERVNLSWGGGSRSCPGRHLAELVVFKVIPALVKEFKIEVDLPPENKNRSYFLSMLIGVKARFIERDVRL